MIQLIKDYLVRLGPDNFLVQAALKVHALRHGYKIEFAHGCIGVHRDKRVMVLSKAQYVQVPIMMECYDLFFSTIDGAALDDRAVLDFSKPGSHRYTKSGAEFYFPSVPEDDVMDAYTNSYKPRPGDVVWDVGAHAGATSYFLARMVGPSGRVYAFEPDEENYHYLLKNIELHQLSNVIPIKKALSGTTGTANFNMDGTMSAGLSEFLVYRDKRHYTLVSTISLPDACAEFGEVPVFVKMDIEGAEIAVIESSKRFLQSRRIHFAIESYHRVDGELTYKSLESMFSSIGYNVRSSDEFGQMFTWTEPHSDGGL